MNWLNSSLPEGEPRVARKLTFWFPTWSDTNHAVQLQRMARGLKFRMLNIDGLYYRCSENKGADQLRGNRKADLRLCFRICKTLVFSRRGSNVKRDGNTETETKITNRKKALEPGDFKYRRHPQGLPPVQTHHSQHYHRSKLDA